ncbi:ABC transporter ATP-binding protein [Prevotella sp. HUN102]|uniref:ABC transporter ATP-binding protein n=1 Tax=Prevotella sp. HUN102 TaxID=1392486 RepID=UPI00048F5ADB|nr:ABC transporter ATP-binding protein [Prevotella sp. HUN102]
MNLEIRNLSKKYRNGVVALADVSLSIENGMFGLLGKNGSGKSTLMRTIAMLQEPDSGSIYINGEDVLSSPLKMKEVLGYLPQEFGVYPNVNAEELLSHIATLKGISSNEDRKRQITELLHKVNLFDVRKKRVDSYSGGMKQRFGIAQALLGNPQIIIVDEPTAGLDPVERNRFYNLLAEIGKDMIVILSTHIVEDVETLCQNMAILNNGHIVCSGKPSDLTHKLTGKLWEIPFEECNTTGLKSQCLLINSYYRSGNKFSTYFSEKDLPYPFKQKIPSLEDFYFYKCAISPF